MLVYCGTNGWMDQDATWYGGRPRPRWHCVRWGPSSPPRKGAQQPPFFGPCLLWPNDRPSQQLLSSCIHLFSKRTFGDKRRRFFYGPDAFLIIQPTVLKQWRKCTVQQSTSIVQNNACYCNQSVGVTAITTFMEWYSLSAKYACLFSTTFTATIHQHHSQSTHTHQPTYVYTHL